MKYVKILFQTLLADEMMFSFVILGALLFAPYAMITTGIENNKTDYIVIGTILGILLVFCMCFLFVIEYQDKLDDYKRENR